MKDETDLTGFKALGFDPTVEITPLDGF